MRTVGRMTLNGVTVTGVHAGGAPGSVLWSAGDDPGIDVTLVNSAITGNDATGIKLDGGGVSVSSSEIAGNTSSGIGLIDGSPLILIDSEVTGNGAKGISTTGQGENVATITDSLIADNADTGFFCQGCEDVNVTGSTIQHNGHGSAPAGGGGIVWTVNQQGVGDAPRLDMIDSVVHDNRATQAGGGIRVGILVSSAPFAPSPILAIGGSDISDNATHGSAVPGGGIAMLTGSLAIGSSSIVGNRSGVGGATANSHGGGIFMQEDLNDGIVNPHDLQLGGVVFDVNQANGAGGGIFARTMGIADLNQVKLFSNTATVRGGGISIGAQALIRDSLFDDNSAPRAGGLFAGRFGRGSELFVTGSTFADNFASVTGGGLLIDDTRTASVANSTFSGNAAPLGGGITIGIDPMDEPERLTLTDTTMAGNSARSGSAVAALEGELATRRVLIVAPLSGSNCAVPPGSRFPMGRSFVSDATCGAHATDVVSAANPQLGPLAANGGPTSTRLPAATAPYGGLVPAAQCAPTDQRGVTRPKGAGCEPGAVEVVEAAGGR